jgi:hypothetical protein
MIADKIKSLRLPARHAFADALFIAGIALVAFGISRWSLPAAFVFGGIAVCYVAILTGRD